MKKLLYGLTLFVVLVIVAVIYAANSSFVIKKVADKFAPEYNISYDSISGNILTGVKVEGLQYANKPLVKSIKFSWNPARLLDKSISIYEIEVQKGNVEVAKSLIASFETNESSSSDPFDFSVSVGKAYISLNAFEEQGIRVDRVLLDAEGIEYASDTLDVKHLSLKMDSNLTNIDIKGSMAGSEVHLDHLSLQKIDTLAIQKFFLKNKSSNQTSSIDHNETTPFIPKHITIKKFHGDILPAVYHPVKIDHLVLDGKDIVFDIEKLMAEKGIIDLNVRTNLSNANYKGEIKNNNLIGKMLLTPNKRLFEHYNLPLRKEAIGDIIIDLDASKERMIADIQAKAKHVYISKKGEYEIDVDHLLSHIVYNIDTNKLQVDTKAVVTTPHAKNISMTNLFLMDENNISYSGQVKLQELRGIDANLTKPFKNLEFKYTGDTKYIHTKMISDMLKGSFDLSDWKKGALHLKTTQAIAVTEMVNLPEELNGSKFNMVLDIPMDFDENVSIKGKMLLTSNVANIDTDIFYGKTLQVKSVMHLPEESLLRSFSEEVKWDQLTPTMADMELADDVLKAKLQTSGLSADTNYQLSSKKIDGTVRLGSLVAAIEGRVNEVYKVHTKVHSLESFIKSVQSIYTLKREEIPVLDGMVELSAETKDFSTADITMKSSKLVYSPDHKTEHMVTDVNVDTSISSDKVVLKEYKVTYDKQKYFSTKPSELYIKDDDITIPQLWLNDQLKGEGKYSLKKQQGYFNADASRLHLTHEFVDLDSEVHLHTTLDGNKTSIKGDIVILNGNVHYDLRQKQFASDDDIIIVQDMKEKKESPFMDNLSVSVKIETKKPLVYKQSDINIKANVHLSLYKTEYAPLMVLGSIEIPKGGTYIFQDKTFVLNNSYIYFTGDINKPIVEASLTYWSINHLITATISGTLALPNINFSSSPSLTREEILSVILFDSKEASGTHSGEDMMKMMGGAMAKSVLSSIGVKLDHLVLGEGNSVEVGKKLTNKLTIIYVEDEVSSVKLKYQYGKRIEGVIGVGEESTSADIIYKRDF